MDRNGVLTVLAIGGVGYLLYQLLQPSGANAAIAPIGDVPADFGSALSSGSSPIAPITDFGSALMSAGTSAKLTFQQIADLWTQYGGDPSKADLAAAVALGESSGNPQAFNSNDPHGGSFGLFQINGIHGALASFDIPTNIQAAIQISNNGQNWNPWGAFTNGSYAKYLP